MSLARVFVVASSAAVCAHSIALFRVRLPICCRQKLVNSVRHAGDEACYCVGLRFVTHFPGLLLFWLLHAISSARWNSVLGFIKPTATSTSKPNTRPFDSRLPRPHPNPPLLRATVGRWSDHADCSARFEHSRGRLCHNTTNTTTQQIQTRTAL